MLKSVEGTYQNGRIELIELPEDVIKTRVIITFLPPAQERLLSDYGIDETQAADLRGRLSAFEEDWNRPDNDALRPADCIRNYSASAFSVFRSSVARVDVAVS